MYLERFRLAGRVAVITGAGRGIGRATADALSEAGAIVVLTDIDAAAAESAAAEIRSLGGQADSMSLDVTNSSEVEAVCSAVVARHGRVDVLVNNAGIALGAIPAERMTDAEWARVIDINLTGVFRCCRAFGRVMLESGGGAIVNVGSMSGDIVNRPQEQAQYNASKAGVHHLTRSLAVEWCARGVRVNAVAPTYVVTEMTRFGLSDPGMSEIWLDMTPMRRAGQPDEIAAVVLFLASDAASLMTGAIVSADAGYTCL